MATPEKSEVTEEIENDVVEVEEELEETETEETETDEISGEEETEEVEPRELEPWEETGEEEAETLPDVPVATHIRAKDKWKRQKSTLQSENEALKAELEATKAAKTNTAPIELKRPDPLDFDDDNEYEEAKDQYLIQRIRLEDKQKEIEAQRKKFQESIEKGVEVHYERVEQFVTEKKINRDVYKSAEQTVINAIESIFPGQGEQNTEFYLSKLGEGSEKIPYFLGRNKAKLAEFQALLREDTTGIAAGIFLGEQKARLRGVTSGKPKTKAPAPAATANGDISTAPGTVKDSRLKKQYDAAHKKNDDDAAWEIRKKAKASGVDVTSW